MIVERNETDITMKQRIHSILERKSFLIGLATIAFTLCITPLIYSCISSDLPIANTTSADNEFESFTKELFVSEVSSSTLVLHYSVSNPENFGISTDTITFGTFPTNTNDTKTTLLNYQTELSMYSYDDLSYENQLTYDILADYFSSSLDSLTYFLYYEPLTPYTGIHCQLPVLLSEYSLSSEEDVIQYLELLGTLPDYFDSLLDFQIAKSKAGLFMSNDRLTQVLSECNSFISIENNYLISTFNERVEAIPNLDADTIEAYQTTNEALIETTVIDAYETLMLGLYKLKNTGTNDFGLCYYEGGRAYYADLVANSTGSSRSIPEIKLLIENQLLSDFEDFQVALTTSYSITDTTLDDASPEEMLLDLKERLIYAFPDLTEVNATIKEVPTEMEDYLSPAFYLIPPLDNTAENTIYINQSKMYDSLTLYTTLAHEGYPGHLYQTTYYASLNPDPIRTILNYGGYVEGWAIYAEMCSYYLSDLPSDIATLEQTNSSIMLGLYCLTDIGIHYEGWDLMDTISFYNTYGITDTTSIGSIYDLVLATPSNYLKYYVGYLEFLELKKECIEVWGTEFSQIRFHEAVLSIGPSPFDILKKYTLETVS